MDPQVVWQSLVAAYLDRDHSTAQESAQNLLRWLEQGGFPPQTMPGITLDDTWNRHVAIAACRAALSTQQVRPT